MITELRRNRGMSPTIFRYLVSEILFSFLVAFLFFFFIFFINQLLLLAQHILSKKVPFNQVVLLVLYALPSIIAMAAPFASLVGTLMTLGRLSTDNEILVMISSGLSYGNIVVPALCVGIFISLVSFFANDVLLPAGAVGYYRLYRRILASTPALELEANSVKRFKDTVIVTGNVAGNVINDVLILDKTSDGERRLILAQQAELRDAGKEGLSLDMRRAFIQSSKEVARRDYDYASSGFLRYWIPQEDLIQSVSSVSAREMSSLDVYREIKVKERNLANRLEERYGRILEQALTLESVLRRGPERESWNRRTNATAAFVRELENAKMVRHDLSLSVFRMEFNKKFSLPFGALSFVFLAVSLGLLLKKNGQTVGIFFGLIISFIYWAMLFGGQMVGSKEGYSPFWSMWAPDILALAVGVILCIVRIRR